MYLGLSVVFTRASEVDLYSEKTFPNGCSQTVYVVLAGGGHFLTFSLNSGAKWYLILSPLSSSAVLFVNSPFSPNFFHPNPQPLTHAHEQACA